MDLPQILNIALRFVLSSLPDHVVRVDPIEPFTILKVSTISSWTCAHPSGTAYRISDFCGYPWVSVSSILVHIRWPILMKRKAFSAMGTTAIMKRKTGSLDEDLVSLSLSLNDCGRLCVIPYSAPYHCDTDNPDTWPVKQKDSWKLWEVEYILTEACVRKAQMATALNGQLSVQQTTWGNKSMFR